MTWANVGTVVAILVGLSALVTFWTTRRRAVLEEGKKAQEVEQLKRDLDRAHEKIRQIEIKLTSAEGDMRELKTDVKHILAAINRLEQKIDVRGCE